MVHLLAAVRAGVDHHAVAAFRVWAAALLHRQLRCQRHHPAQQRRIVRADLRQRGLERARQCTWEATVQHMQDLIAEAVRPKDRRSAKPIEPAPDVQLQYKYTPTPGS